MSECECDKIWVCKAEPDERVNEWNNKWEFTCMSARERVNKCVNEGEKSWLRETEWMNWIESKQRILNAFMSHSAPCVSIEKYGVTYALFLIFSFS